MSAVWAEMAEVEPTAPASMSVVIVNWNSGDELRACLASLRENPPSGALDVVVVDNGSADDSVALARPALDGVTWVLNGSNRGLAAANNQGIIASAGEIIVISNPDVRYLPGTLDAFADAFRRHARAAFVVPRATTVEGAVQTTAGDLPTLGEAILGRQVQRRRSRAGTTSGYCWDGWAHDEERTTGRAGDVCFAARRQAVAEIGLQDERFPLDWEAIDWSARAADLGWQIVFTPAAQVVHIAGSSTGKASRPRWVIQTHKGMYEYFAKRAGPAGKVGLATLFGVRAALKIGMMGVGVPLYQQAQRATWGDAPSS